MTQAQPQALVQQAPEAHTLQEPRIGSGPKACAVGAGVVGSVCCGGGLAAAVATGVGAVGAVGFMRSWVSMQGVTLISTAFAVALVLALTWFVTRRARTGLAPGAARRVYRRSLFRLSAWALGGYIVYFVGVNMILSLAGFQYAGGN